jgi:predicted nuclease of predicted toxin-antitoxin system
MRILLDHNLPRQLAKAPPDSEVATARSQGWDDLENGELLKAAEEKGFEVFLTGDKNLGYQQNLKGRRLAVIVVPVTNRPQLEPYYPQIREAVRNPHAFKAWSGKSKVVDDHGRPLVVYHGTDASFEAFDPDRVGSSSTKQMDKIQGVLWFAQTPEGRSYFSGRDGPGANVIPVFCHFRIHAWLLWQKMREHATSISS